LDLRNIATRIAEGDERLPGLAGVLPRRPDGEEGRRLARQLELDRVANPIGEWARVSLGRVARVPEAEGEAEVGLAVRRRHQASQGAGRVDGPRRCGGRACETCKNAECDGNEYDRRMQASPHPHMMRPRVPGIASLIAS
jgi:hypothetical protein